MSDHRIKSLRRAIDGIDEQLLELINRRLRLAQEIGGLKKEMGRQVVDPDRESTLIQRLVQKNPGPLNDSNLYHIFREIITVSRSIQETRLNSYLGPGTTSVFTVIGNPVSHSLSPVMHNRAFSATGYDGVYVAFEVEDIAAAMLGLKALGIKGASITIPHKMSVMEHLDDIDPQARRIGAVNTVVSREGALSGTNTDVYGAVEALKRETAIRGNKFVILGAGGAARAIGYGIRAEGGQLVIVNRSRQRGEALAAELNAEFQWLPEIFKLDGQILVNTTPLGMIPDVDRSPIDKSLLEKEMVVMDIIYNPLETRLLREAREVGCRTVSGLSMFVLQGARQFELWTGLKPPVEVMEEAVKSGLQRV